ncbi:aminotransferase-like domain-containing protein [Leeia aquatica]|uniref:Putative 8-amino-7-oxononanoate synthase n=1 Tax=Leeia aquatica TaxID=2725557 RepID=A0A847S4J2_9NEIS|nr:PLP-dependent aminotransferase family protein [Leeia aquatica]NLR76661.1 PLP-dependent aminotransferase family protein [Leeia aquatica]
MPSMNILLDNLLDTPLVAQITSAIRQAQADGVLKAGERMWSIRGFAAHYGVSTFTVAEAYDRLVAEGVLFARRGDGFFLSERPHQKSVSITLPIPHAANAFWLADSLYEPPLDCAKPGSGWMHYDWYDQDGIRTALRLIANKQHTLSPYGDSKGLPGLREWLARAMTEESLEVSAPQILLTQGASQAITLAILALTKPGDTVLVDDPGYFGLHSALSIHGRHAIGVPWTPSGPDIALLEGILQRHTCKAFFTNPWLQNPTGASYSPAVAHKVLRLVEQNDMWLVENDVSQGLSSRPRVTLATLDELRRVVYVGSFSKTLAPSLRVGFVVANHAVIDALTHHKMMLGLTSSEITERVALQLLTEGKYRHRLASLRERLVQKKEAGLALLDRFGLKVFTNQSGGPFLWVSIPPDVGCPIKLTEEAIAKKVMLAPGALFRVNQPPTPWMRFNVAYLDDPRVASLLESWSR